MRCAFYFYGLWHLRAVVVCMYACCACTYVFFNVCVYDAFMYIHNTRKTKDREEYCTLASGARETYYLDMDRSMVTRARAHLRGNALRCCCIHYPFCSSSLSREDPHLNAQCKRGEGRGKMHTYYRQADFTQYSMPQCLMTHSTSSRTQCLPSPLFP